MSSTVSLASDNAEEAVVRSEELEEEVETLRSEIKAVRGNLKKRVSGLEDRHETFAKEAAERISDERKFADTVVAIESVTERELAVSGIDVVDGTPLLDIKPFVPEFDIPSEVETGWLDASESAIRSEQADKRFL
ncbi:MAG: TrmO family methyltransferase domain-containing protein [Natrinema limicola]